MHNTDNNTNATNNEFISIREFARRVDVNESTVRGHINNSRFTNGIEYDDKGKPRIVWPVALDEWRAFGGGLERANRRGRTTSDAYDPNLPDIDTSRQKTEYYKAQTAEIEYRVLKGELISEQQVYATLFELGAAIRTAVLAVPDHTVDDIMAARTKAKGIEILRAAIEKALVPLTRTDISPTRNEG